MFNFTTTTLIHSLDLFVANPTNTTFQGGYSDSTVVQDSSNGTFWVNGVNLFRKDRVVAIYRSPFMLPLAGRLLVNVNNIYKIILASKVFGPNNSDVPSSVRVRLKFSLRRTNDNNSYYARDEVFHGKDFVYEFVVTSTDNNAVAKVAKQIKKINRLYGDIYLDVHVGTTAEDDALKAYDGNTANNLPAFGNSVNDDIDQKSQEGLLVFVNDNFGMFTDATLEVWVDGHSDCCTYQEGGWVPFDQIACQDAICVTNCSLTSCDSLTRGVKESTNSLLFIVDCVNGTGTYQQILRDLRLPTMENLAYGSLTQQMNEMPIPGMNYVQYTLHYVSCRGVLGGSAVGEVTHSKTTHVFFVPATCCTCEGNTTINTYDIDAAFLAALYEAFGWKACNEEADPPAPVGRIAPAPHDDPTLHPKFKGQLAPAKTEDVRTSNDTTPAATRSEIEARPENNEEPETAGGDVPGKSSKPISNSTIVNADPNTINEP